MVKFLEACRKLCFCCGKRKYDADKSPDYENREEFSGGIENVAYEKENTLEPNMKSRTYPEQKLTNVIQTHDFLEQYKDMITYEDISREFEEIKTTFRSEVVSNVAQLPANRGKNRYMNILPNEVTRVKLPGPKNYINANSIIIKDQPRDYIATQGPLPGTKDDFWNMVWTEKSLVIVMLVQLVENGRIKCDQYWPFDEKKESVSDSLDIEKTEENILPLWTERTFYLSNGTESRKVRHYQFTSWGSGSDIPPNVADLVSFIRHLRSDLPLEDIGPMVVHCSDGSFKTGVFIALYQVLRDLTDASFVNILGMVYHMKKCRQSLLSTETQYKLIYDSVRDSLMGKFAEPDAISDGIKNASSAENINEEDNGHRPYVNPALMDDSSSDSSGSLTDSDDELPTVMPNTMKATEIGVVDNSSSTGSEPF